MTKDLTCNLILSTEQTYDIDELWCIIQQLEAICEGWGMDFSVHTTQENLIYEWKNATATK